MLEAVFLKNLNWKLENVKFHNYEIIFYSVRPLFFTCISFILYVNYGKKQKKNGQLFSIVFFFLSTYLLLYTFYLLLY